MKLPEKNEKKKPDEIPKGKITQITYSISAVYSDSELSFYPDGRMDLYARVTQTSNAGKYKDSGKITPEQFNELAKLIEETGFFSWEKGYFEPSLCDGETNSISVIKEGKEKIVSCHGSAPEGFDKIVAKIKQFWPKPLHSVGV